MSDYILTKGYEACFEGKTLADNPYFDSKNKNSVQDWDRGWKQALKDKKKKTKEKREFEKNRVFRQSGCYIPRVPGETEYTRMQTFNPLKNAVNRRMFSRTAKQKIMWVCPSCKKEFPTNNVKIYKYGKEKHNCYECHQKNNKELKQAMLSLAKRKAGLT